MKPAETDKPLIMGILNLTDDSFSDGGKYLDPGAAVEHALAMASAGADIIDVGGESTRPGSDRIPAVEQIRRVVPVIRPLREKLPQTVAISIDTSLSEVAEAALEAGAGMINDVFAGRDDGGLFEIAASREVPIALMHMQGTPATMQDNPRYEDVVAEVREFLLRRAQAARQSGVKPEAIVLDPGIGFGKTREHNLQLLAGLEELVACGYPVLLGTSRKRFMGGICNIDEYERLVGATCATTALGVMAGVKIFRVHDVMENRQAADVAYALKNVKSRGEE